jgi:hypothetical protein
VSERGKLWEELVEEEHGEEVGREEIIGKEVGWEELIEEVRYMYFTYLRRTT